MSEFVAHVFGKQGCSKCQALKRRLADLLARPEYADFKMEYHDVLTEDGVVKFCKAGCLNPNRIPALLVSVDGRYVINPLSYGDTSVDVFKASFTYSWVGIQTDYDNGGGLITPAMVKEVLDDAKEVVYGTKAKEEVQGDVCYQEGEAAGC